MMAPAPKGEVKPLIMVGQTNTTAEVVTGNLTATFARGYKPLLEVKEYQGPVSIVGAGFSLRSTYKDIVGDVIACNSAHDFLIEKGIIPKYTMVWDANPIMENIIKKPHKDVKYLFASRCHPSLFEKFKGYDVTVWHALGGDDGLEGFLVRNQRNEPMIAGGSAAVTRATHLAGAMGYTKEMHLFGVCDANDGKNTHAMGSLIKQDFMHIRVCGKWFYVAPWMAMQAGDFKVLAPLLKQGGVRLIVHGTGLIPYISTFMDIETPDIRVSLYEKARRHVHAVCLLYLQLRKSPQLLGGLHAGI